MHVGEEKSFTVEPEEAYGNYDARRVQDFPREKLPADREPQPGMSVIMTSPEGQQILARITKVTDNTVTLDANHPLAGERLHFQVKVVGIN
jgi:FKBP-type peptidyl-prolyl cis-trans isomerase 2